MRETRRSFDPSIAPAGLIFRSLLGVILGSILGLIVLALPAPAVADPQTKDQQKCTNALNKDLAGHAGAIAKEIQACMQDGAKGKLPSGIEACSVADADGKIAKAAEKTADDFAKLCTGTSKNPPGAPRFPPFGATDAATNGEAAREAAYGLAHDVFGIDLDLAITSEAEDKDESLCQRAVARSSFACHQALVREFNACKKNGLRNAEAPIDSAAGLEACIGADPAGKIAKKCDLLDEVKPGKLEVDGIRGAIAKKCVAKDVELDGAFAGCAASDAEEAHACLERNALCRACLVVNEADGLAVDCDLFDDGTANETCPPFVIGAQTCTLDEFSGFLFDSAQGFLGGALAGTATIACGNVDPATGSGACQCGLGAIEPVEVVGGWACIRPAEGCALGEVSCDGGNSLDYSIEADHDIGDCESHADCASQCETHCGSLGAEVFDSGCEGFCDGGPSHGAACTNDAQCPQGSCRGRPVHGSICQCQCIDRGPVSPGGGPSRPGGVRCEIGVAVDVETALPCDGADVQFAIGPHCIPFTTETSFAVLHDQDAAPGSTLGNESHQGLPLSCPDLSQGASGMYMGAVYDTFDVPAVGDVHLLFSLGCE